MFMKLRRLSSLFGSPFSSAAVSLAVLLLSACSSWQNPLPKIGNVLKDPLQSIQPYKLDIPQGNVVTQAMVDKLKPGMTRAQVRFVLGTPLVVDPFRTNRWDYVYAIGKAGTVQEQRRISVLFGADDTLVKIEGDVTAKGGQS